MKLFKIDYMDDCDDESTLMVAEDQEAVNKNLKKKFYLNYPALWVIGYME